MRERDYALATNIGRFHAIESALKMLNTGVGYHVPEKEYRQVVAAVAKWRQRTFAEVNQPAWKERASVTGVLLDRALAQNERLAGEVARLQAELTEANIASEQAVLVGHEQLARANKLSQSVFRLREALERVEWARLTDDEDWLICPWCNADKDDGHKPDCARQAALQSPPETPQEPA
jgi:hypothetical protein